MKSLLKMHLMEDDANVVIGQEGDQLVAQYDGGDPESLGDGPLHVVWLALRGRQGVPRLRAMFICDDLGPEVERVSVESPYMEDLARRPRGHGDDRRPLPFFISGPQLFKPGDVIARWQTEDKKGWRTIREERVLLEEWGYVAGNSWGTLGDADNSSAVWYAWGPEDFPEPRG